MKRRTIINLGKKFQLKEENSVGMLLSFFNSVDDFIGDLNEKKFSYFKRERLSKKERNFIREVIHDLIIPELIKEEREIHKGVLSEKKTSQVKVPTDILFQPAYTLQRILKSLGGKL